MRDLSTVGESINSIKSKTNRSVCDELKLQLYSKNINNVTAPAILLLVVVRDSIR